MPSAFTGAGKPVPCLVLNLVVAQGGMAEMEKAESKNTWSV